MDVLAPEAAFRFTEQVNVSTLEPVQVFRALVHEMPSDVFILPSENCLYFTFTDHVGAAFKGCLSLGLRADEAGTVSFFYAKCGREKGEEQFELISQDHGLSLSRIGQFLYVLEIDGKQVRLHLNRLPLKKPSRSLLRASEIYVAPAFDESGLHFSLIFDHQTNSFLWLLNDDFPTFEVHRSENEHLLVSDRTRFVFLDDTRNQRRVLVGVSKAEASSNSYYDGPFDQLPDNYIASGEIELQKYIELNNPDRRGQIDQFGFFNLLPGYRVAIVPYKHYSEVSDLFSVAEQYACLSETEFYKKFLAEVNVF